MEGKFDNETLLFIERTLEIHGEHLCDLLRDEIEKRTLIKDQDLIDSIDFDVRKYGMDPVLLVHFISYGRAIEIAWHKRKLNSKQWTRPNANVLLWGMRENRLKKKIYKDTKWYAKTAYGSVNSLISKLSAGFSEQERLRLREILDIRHELKSR